MSETRWLLFMGSGPNPTSKPRSFDDLINSRPHVGRNREADLLGTIQTDDQLKPYRRLHGKVARLSDLENLLIPSGSTAVVVGLVGRAGHQTPSVNTLRAST